MSRDPEQRPELLDLLHAGPEAQPWSWRGRRGSVGGGAAPAGAWGLCPVSTGGWWLEDLEGFEQDRQRTELGCVF